MASHVVDSPRSRGTALLSPNAPKRKDPLRDGIARLFRVRLAAAWHAAIVQQQQFQLDVLMRLPCGTRPANKSSKLQKGTQGLGAGRLGAITVVRGSSQCRIARAQPTSAPSISVKLRDLDAGCGLGGQLSMADLSIKGKPRWCSAALPLLYGAVHITLPSLPDPA
ncbi:hypothetical protein PG990_001974 [Apiospora arundinis]|uniref:Uncharacterized protein n=1 Tax=Apiospora arundinis TaxID=335852 RepID=A0ABR2I3K6_9PEZI